MSPTQITASAAALCSKLIADPDVDPGRKSVARKVMDFLECVRIDRTGDPFYVECIRHLMADLSGASLP